MQYPSYQTKNKPNYQNKNKRNDVHPNHY